MREGTIVDAILIAAPPSTKNKDGKHDPEMHQSKKGNDWHFGMKAHIGVDAASGLVHTVIGTAGNVSDVTQAHALLHGAECQPRWRELQSGDNQFAISGPRFNIAQGKTGHDRLFRRQLGLSVASDNFALGQDMPLHGLN